MNIVVGSTTSETSMIKAIQAAIGANQDGEIGTQTMSDIACQLGADCFPLTLKIYSMPVLIANDIVVVATRSGNLAQYANALSGSFSMAEAVGGGVPVSICVSDGSVKRKYSCHYSDGFPESVLYKTKAGKHGIDRVKLASELPSDLQWAVGGVGLLDNYDPDAEGFCKVSSGDYSDVLRDTNHTMLGVKNGYVYLVYCKSMTGKQVNAFAETLGLEKAIMLDGGHIAGINGAENFAQINTAQTQYYMIQGV